MRSLSTRTCRVGASGLSLLCLASCTGPFSGRTPRIAAASTGNAMSVAMLRTVSLGGAAQHVLVRGHDRTRTIVLFLHGGPGMPAMYLAHAFQRQMEREFVMVHWDRRGAGKSYAARFPVESLTVRRTLDDLYELREWLRAQFGDSPVILVGHSWGSQLALLAVRERPQLFKSLVVTGVLTEEPERRRVAQRDCVIARARESGDSVLARRLSLPASDSTPQITESLLFRVGGELRLSRSVWKIVRTGLAAPEYSFLDGLHVQKGSQFVQRHMRENVDAAWQARDSRLEVPVVMALGAYDCNTPSSLAAEFLDRLQAPRKQAVWFTSSAHFPFWEEPARFRDVLRLADS